MDSIAKGQATRLEDHVLYSLPPVVSNTSKLVGSTIILLCEQKKVNNIEVNNREV